MCGLGPKMGLSGPYLVRSLILLKNMSKPNLSTISLIFMSVDRFKGIAGGVLYGDCN